MIFLGWYFNHGHVLVSFKEIFDADDVWNFALDIDGQADRDKALQLYFQESLNYIILPDWRDLDCYLDLSSLLLSDLEPNLFKILKSFVTSDREDILIQIVELWIVAFGNDSQHEWILSILLDDLIFESDGNVELFNGSWEESSLAEHDIGSVDLYEIFSFGELCRILLVL